MELKLVECNEKYWNFVRKLRLDPHNLMGFIERKYISGKQQNAYMNKWSDNYRICLLDENPVGFIGQINGDIRVCTDHKFKNKGIGKFMVNEFLKQNKNIFAKVKIENIESLRLFESCGFKKTYYILEP